MMDTDFFTPLTPKRRLFLNKPYPGSYIRAFNDVMRGMRSGSYIDYRGGLYFLNLTRRFNDYHILLPPYMANVYMTLALSTPKDFTDYYKELKRFLNFREESNYKVLQNYFNNELWESNTPEEYFCFIILMNYSKSRKYIFTEHGFSGEWKDNGLEDGIDYILNTIEFLSSIRESIFFYSDPTPLLKMTGGVHYIDLLEKSLSVDVKCVDMGTNGVVILDYDERKDVYPSFSVKPLSNGCSLFVRF